jgi:hypothetical protein
MATILLLRVRPGGACSLGDNPPLLGEPTTKAKSAFSPPLLSLLGDVANLVDIGDASYIRALSDGCGVDLAEFILDAWRDTTSSPSSAAMRVRSSRSWDWNACVLRMSRLLFRRRLVTSGSLCPPIGDGGMLRGGSTALCIVCDGTCGEGMRDADKDIVSCGVANGASQRATQPDSQRVRKRGNQDTRRTTRQPDSGQPDSGQTGKETGRQRGRQRGSQTDKYRVAPEVAIGVHVAREDLGKGNKSGLRRQQTADCRKQTADRRQQTADSRQQTADGRRQTVSKG